jgi:hypothetical protein
MMGLFCGFEIVQIFPSLPLEHEQTLSALWSHSNRRVLKLLEEHGLTETSEMNSVDAFQKGIRDEIAAVEKEFQSPK